MKARWESERASGTDQRRQGRIDQLKFDAAQAEREGDFGKVAEIRYGRMKETEDELAKAKEELLTMQAPPR